MQSDSDVGLLSAADELERSKN